MHHSVSTSLCLRNVHVVQVSVLGYFMFGYQADFSKFLLCLVTIVLTFWTAESLGLLFAVFTPTTDLAIVAFTLVIMPLLSLTGFLASSMPVYYKWVQHISFLRYVPTVTLASAVCYRNSVLPRLPAEYRTCCMLHAWQHSFLTSLCVHRLLCRMPCGLDPISRFT